MRYPWANVLIGGALAVSLVTGFLTLTSNHSPYLADVHAASSLAVVVIFWWKVWNIRVGLRRWRRRPVSTSASLLLAAMVVGIMATGVYWSNVGPYNLVGFSGMTWHGMLAIPAVVLVVAHVLRQHVLAAAPLLGRPAHVHAHGRRRRRRPPRVAPRRGRVAPRRLLRRR